MLHLLRRAPAHRNDLPTAVARAGIRRAGEVEEGRHDVHRRREDIADLPGPAIARHVGEKLRPAEATDLARLLQKLID